MQLNYGVLICLLGSCYDSIHTQNPSRSRFAVRMFLCWMNLSSAGAVYTSQNIVGDALQILQKNGLNSIRLRLFHTPTERRDGLPHMLELARRGHELNLKIILNLHYSDTWADPSVQQKPSAWSNLSEPALRDSVYEHTYQADSSPDRPGHSPDNRSDRQRNHHRHAMEHWTRWGLI